MLHKHGAAFLLIGLAAGLASADESWKEYANKDGITFEKRRATDSKFYEYRGSTVETAAVSPATYSASEFAEMRKRPWLLFR